MIVRLFAISILALSLTLAGCGWHHRHHARHGGCQPVKQCACQCPNAQTQAPAPATVQ